jgi:hypothetical protein
VRRWSATHFRQDGTNRRLLELHHRRSQTAAGQLLS